jgi:predicted transcriptional regulator
MVATELVNKHSLNQAQAAKLLGVSQPAISLYQKKLRGNSLDLWSDPDISASVSKQAELLANSVLDTKTNVEWFCSVCKTLRSKGYLCKIHKDLDSTVDIANCNFCKDLEPNAMSEDLKDSFNQADL